MTAIGNVPGKSPVDSGDDGPRTDVLLVGAPCTTIDADSASPGTNPGMMLGRANGLSSFRALLRSRR